MGRFFLTRGLRNLRQGNLPSRCQTQKGNCLTIGFISPAANHRLYDCSAF